MRARPLLALAPLGLMLAAGCGPAKLDVKKDYTLTPGEAQMILLPAQPKPQRITVEYTSDVEIEVGIYLSADVKEDQTPPTTKARALDKAKKAGTLTADLNPDQATTVYVSALSKKATVHVEVTNRK